MLSENYLTCRLLTSPQEINPTTAKSWESWRYWNRLLILMLISITAIFSPVWGSAAAVASVHTCRLTDWTSDEMPDWLNVKTHPCSTHRIKTGAQWHNMWYLRKLQLYANVSWHAPACSLFSVGFTAIMKGWADRCSHGALASHETSHAAAVSLRTRAMLSFPTGSQESMFNSVAFHYLFPMKPLLQQNMSREHRNADNQRFIQSHSLSSRVTQKLFLTPLI